MVRGLQRTWLTCNNKDNKECEGVDTKRRASWLTGKLNPSRQGAGLMMEKWKMMKLQLQLRRCNLSKWELPSFSTTCELSIHAASPIWPNAVGQTVGLFVKIAGASANRYRR